MTLVDTAMALESRSIARRRYSRIAGRVFIYGCLILVAALYLAPLASMMFTSLKSMDEIRGGNLLAPPVSPTFEAWTTVWSSACISVSCEGLRGYFGNSFLIVVPATVVVSRPKLDDFRLPYSSTKKCAPR